MKTSPRRSGSTSSQPLDMIPTATALDALAALGHPTAIEWNDAPVGVRLNFDSGKIELSEDLTDADAHWIAVPHEDVPEVLQRLQFCQRVYALESAARTGQVEGAA